MFGSFLCLYPLFRHVFLLGTFCGCFRNACWPDRVVPLISEMTHFASCSQIWWRYVTSCSDIQCTEVDFWLNPLSTLWIALRVDATDFFYTSTVFRLCGIWNYENRCSWCKPVCHAVLTVMLLLMGVLWFTFPQEIKEECKKQRLLAQASQSTTPAEPRSASSPTQSSHSVFGNVACVVILAAFAWTVHYVLSNSAAWCLVRKVAACFTLICGCLPLSATVVQK